MMRMTAPHPRVRAARWHSLLLLLTLLLSNLTQARVEFDGESRNRRVMVGAFFPANPEDPFVLQAVEFCLLQLSAQKSYSFLGSLPKMDPKDYPYKIIQAQQQVVAGRNYRLTIELLEKSKKCLGAFQVVIYDHFGELSITNWGQELTCQDVKKMEEMEKMKKETSEDGSGQ